MFRVGYSAGSHQDSCSDTRERRAKGLEIQLRKSGTELGGDFGFFRVEGFEASFDSGE